MLDFDSLCVSMDQLVCDYEGSDLRAPPSTNAANSTVVSPLSPHIITCYCISSNSGQLKRKITTCSTPPPVEMVLENTSRLLSGLNVASDLVVTEHATFNPGFVAPKRSMIELEDEGHSGTPSAMTCYLTTTTNV